MALRGMASTIPFRNLTNAGFGQAVTDIPAVLFSNELLAAYPDAKVIVTSRPVEKWVESVERSFYAILSWKRWQFLQLVDTVTRSVISSLLC